MADFHITDIDLTKEGKAYLAELQKLIDHEVRVGFEVGKHAYEDGTDLVAIAAFNEFGSSDTPARPFVKQSFELHENELMQICWAALNNIYNGGTAETSLKQIGVFVKGLMQQEIIDGDFEPNAPSTIKKKGSATPLIDTGFMRQNVEYSIKRV